MKVVWIVIMAATGAMSLIAASLLAQPLSQNERTFLAPGQVEPSSSCVFCETDTRAPTSFEVAVQNQK